MSPRNEFASCSRCAPARRMAAGCSAMGSSSTGSMRSPRPPSWVKASQTRWVTAPKSTPQAASSHCLQASVAAGSLAPAPARVGAGRQQLDQRLLRINHLEQPVGASPTGRQKVSSASSAVGLEAGRVPGHEPAEIGNHAADDDRGEQAPASQQRAKGSTAAGWDNGKRHRSARTVIELP